MQDLKMASSENDVAPPAAVAVAKKRRIRRDGGFEKNRRHRNKLDAANIKALNTRLNKWFKKTNSPTVALTLLRSKGGQMYIKYSGPKEFESFARSKSVIQKFSSIVTEKMKETNLRIGGDDHESSVRGTGGIDSIDNAVVQTLMEQDVLDLPIDEKRKLITQIVVGSVACAANETCCYVWGETVMMEVDPPTCVTCMKCFRHFHKFCVTEKEEARFDKTWKCGCDVRVDDLKTLDGFQSEHHLDYLFRRWDSEVKTFICAILKGKIGSRRNRIVKIGLPRLFPRHLHNYQWLVGELDGNLKQSIARIGSSLPCFRKYSCNKRDEIKRLTLAPEVFLRV
eukprot:Seg2749.1 transcript_id=Seg2749.1/GoldUCD/mRNA.D3Y31 product="hypothetical protein" protein_id=Seg2749.1/GoldUCD/D3Y31